MSDEHTASSEEWTPKGETRSMPMNDVEIPENYASVLRKMLDEDKKEK